jgi:hypothetical protein
VQQFPVVQVIAQRDVVSTRVWEDPRLGWRDLCAGGVEFIQIDARHENFFDTESAEAIAVRLEKPLQRANE